MRVMAGYVVEIVGTKSHCARPVLDLSMDTRIALFDHGAADLFTVPQRGAADRQLGET